MIICPVKGNVIIGTDVCAAVKQQGDGGGVTTQCSLSKGNVIIGVDVCAAVE